MIKNIVNRNCLFSFFISLLIIAFCSIHSININYAGIWQTFENNIYYKNESGENVTSSIIKDGDSKYYVDEEGKMVRKYLLEDYDDNVYYFGTDGKMVKDTWLCIYADKVKNVGTYVANTYWYYFKSDGKAMKSKGSGVNISTIEGKKYIFNEYGQMLTGFIDASGESITFEDNDNPFEEAVYYCGDENDGVVHLGWYDYVYGYETEDEDDYRYKLGDIYLYFDLRSGKKVTGKKTINKKEYLFNDEGIMMTTWDSYENNISDDAYYYGDMTDGAKTKQKWVYRVPSALLDAKAYNDEEEKYLYYDNSGLPTRNKIKKINGEYYAFDKSGIMKTGLVIFHETDGYVATVDFDYAVAEDFIKRGELATGETKTFYINYDGTASVKNTETGYPKSGNIKLHYFAEIGERKVGLNKIKFNDYDISFKSSNTGHKKTNVGKSEMILNGVVASTLGESKYGIVVTDNSYGYEAQGTNFVKNLQDNNYVVINEKGKIQKGRSNAVKDDSSNYWLIGGKTKDKYLRGIWTENVKYVSNANYTFSDVIAIDDVSDMTDETIYYFLVDNGYIDETIYNLDVDSCNFEIVKTSTANEYKIRMKNIRGYMYLDENNADKNTWTPCGVLDANGKTICINDYSRGDYQAELSDTFFVNCFWN